MHGHSSIKQLLLLSSTALISSTAIAQVAEIAIKPGLWEVTTTSNLLSLASQVPPDQMKQLNDLAKEYGFDVPEIQNGAAKSMTCVTPDMAKQKIVPGTFENQAGCTVNHVTRNGNAYRMEYVCKNPQLDGSGVAQGTLTNAEQFTGQTTFNGTVQGNPISEQANINGKWVNANCESINTLPK
ncbi:MAG: hypothetical protein B7X95_02030 [Methylophilaceae bacterium 17-44-8]|jgi:hypothetical protein|nr:MAG: hypothetical protein B7Y48_00705 [Methylophilales bacterium 28-44-11]OZA06581.1 MAG: hypothetical protein B7X95_02030 [Methylophilaceae bacterium 17-44-8]